MNNIQQLKEKIRGLKVLFVDDEKDVREGTGTFLNKFFDNVEICTNGEEALDVFKKNNHFDIIITDIMMPKMDGIEMSKAIRQIDSKIFIIFLTASRNMKEYDIDLSDITLQKPLSFDDMILIMEKLSEKQW